MHENERLMAQMEAEPEMEAFRARIIDAFSQDPESDEIQNLLDEYEKQYGQDLFWKMTSFDRAEVSRDIEEMKSLAESMEGDSLSPVLRAVNAARIAYSQERYGQAMEALDQAGMLQDDEEALLYLHLRGIVAFALRDYKEAARAMEDVMLDVEDEQISGIAGICYLRLGKEARGKEYLSRMASLIRENDYSWLYDLLVSFDELDIIAHPAFPEQVRMVLEMKHLSESGLNASSLEDAILSDPELFLPLLLDLSRQMSENETSCYFVGLAYEGLGDEKNARRWYRKTLRSESEASFQDQEGLAASLYFKLHSLEQLNYSDKVQIRYLKEFWDKLAFHHAAKIDLIMYASLHEYGSLVNRWISPEELPEARTPDEAMKLHTAMLYFFYQNSRFGEAYEEAVFLYERTLFYTAMPVLLTAFLFMMYDHSCLGYPSEQDYDSLLGYMADQLIALEQLRMTGRISQLKKEITRLYKIRRTRPEPEWEFFDDFLRIFYSHLEHSDPMASFLAGMLPAQSG